MLLNMIIITVMIKLGKVYENFMDDIKISNEKLKVRVKNIVLNTTNASVEYPKKF